MNTDILALVVRTAEDMNPGLLNPIAIEMGASAALFGPDAPLDSMALVRFVVEVESAVEDETGTSVVIASERAMSQRRSPFLTLGTLAEYISQLIIEAEETRA